MPSDDQMATNHDATTDHDGHDVVTSGTPSQTTASQLITTTDAPTSKTLCRAITSLLITTTRRTRRQPRRLLTIASPRRRENNSNERHNFFSNLSLHDDTTITTITTTRQVENQMTLDRVGSPLPNDLEDLVLRVIRCCLAVHRGLGPGYNESTYARACMLELRWAGLQFEQEKSVCVRYRGEVVCSQRIDLFVESQLVVELKSVDAIHPVHIAQTVSYLRVTGARVGLIVNFNVALLKQGIRRVVL
jgi:GxxExxY protein